MDTQLYIPKRIKVGYQTRTDTYTGKLAYIIYFDDKGVLRKEKSWEGWRDKKIDAEEFDNTPQDGLVLHKDIKRYKWADHFGSKRTMIRIYDPRGVEFEITTENLIGVLMNSDCSKRGFIGTFVYAWAGPELVLLPTASEEYQEAIKFTKLQAGKVSAKDMIPGHVYETKRQEKLIYVGRYDWYKADMYRKKPRTARKQYIFVDADAEPKKEIYWILKSGLESIASHITDEPVSNLCDWIEKFQENNNSSKIVSFELKPTAISTKTNESHPSYVQLKRDTYFTIENDVIKQWSFGIQNKYDHTTQKYSIEHYYCRNYGNFHSKTHCPVKDTNNSYYHAANYRTYKESQIDSLQYYDLYATLENGKKIQIKTLHDL